MDRREFLKGAASAIAWAISPKAKEKPQEQEEGFVPTHLMHGGNIKPISVFGEFVTVDLPWFVFHEIYYPDSENPIIHAIWHGSLYGNIYRDGQLINQPVVLSTRPTWNMLQNEAN